MGGNIRGGRTHLDPISCTPRQEVRVKSTTAIITITVAGAPQPPASSRSLKHARCHSRPDGLCIPRTTCLHYLHFSSGLLLLHSKPMIFLLIRRPGFRLLCKSPTYLSVYISLWFSESIYQSISINHSIQSSTNRLAKQQSRLNSPNHHCYVIFHSIWVSINQSVHPSVNKLNQSISQSINNNTSESPAHGISFSHISKE